MTRTVAIISDAATAIGAVPLLWMGRLRFLHRDPSIPWWAIASAFGVSFLADLAAHWVNPWMMSPLYLVGQAGLIGAVFLAQWEAISVAVVLGVTAVLAVWLEGTVGPDVLLHSAAWLSVVAIIYPLKQLDRLRQSLLVYFGLGWLCWMSYAFDPGWTSWGLYQTTRLAGILLFCWAASDPAPHFKLLRNYGNKVSA